MLAIWGITLLSDYVFSQVPKLVNRLVDRITEPSAQDQTNDSLPSGSIPHL
jgi:hypothetical protein